MNYLLCFVDDQNCNTLNFCKRDIKVTVSNPCGSIEYLASVGYDQNPLARTSNSTTYKIYPNPSSDFVNIGLRDENNIPLIGTKVSGELFDILGFQKSKVEIVNNKAIFSVVGLPKGIYVLKIYVDDQLESHQIAVQ